MNAVISFIKDIFMIMPEKSFVGLSGIKPKKKSVKKHIAKSVKKSEPKLSDLMRRKSYEMRENCKFAVTNKKQNQ